MRRSRPLAASVALLLAAAAPAGASHAPAPVASGPSAVLPATAVAPSDEAGPVLAATSRDCGFSVELSDGVALWVFCDSADATLSYFRTSTAALAGPEAPLELHEPVDGAGRPFQLVTLDPADPVCVGDLAGQVPVAWPTDGTRVPGPGGTDRVLVTFLALCLDKAPGVAPTLADYTAVSMGIAAWDRRPGDPVPPAEPIVASVLERTLWPAELDALGKVVTFGTSLVAGGDGYVYSHRCGWYLGCQVARAPVADVATPSAWRYWTGIWWQDTPPGSGTVGLSGTGPPVSSFRVVHVPALGAYVMGYASFPGAGVDAVAVRLADHPWGPFSAPVEVPIAACGDGSGCYSGAPHSQLSGPGHVGVSLYDTARPGTPARSVIAAAAGLSVDRAGPCETRFRDVDGAHPFCAEIDWAADGSLVTGWADGTFRPGAVVSRQAVAAWLWRAAGSPPPTAPGAASFADVPAGSAFDPAVGWLVEQGIAAGYADGTFRPTAPVSRQALAVWRWRGAGSPPGPFEAPALVDAPTAAPFATAVAWAAAEGIVTGYADGTFRPEAPVTRQALVAMLRRSLP